MGREDLCQNLNGVNAVFDEQPFVGRFNQLESSTRPQQRGVEFEHLLADVFRQAHFQVVRNAGAAKPRQTDLVATYGPDHYLIEAKWEQHPADVSHIDGVRSRLGRTAGTVIGVIIAVGGSLRIAPQTVALQGEDVANVDARDVE